MYLNRNVEFNCWFGKELAQITFFRKENKIVFEAGSDYISKKYSASEFWRKYENFMNFVLKNYKSYKELRKQGYFIAYRIEL